jgi:hypothetical protein
MARPPSAADHDFAARLNALGIPATAQRVQYFLAVGLLLAPPRSFPGGGGSVGRYPPEAVERIGEAIALAEQHPRHLQLAAAVMFVRGRFPMHEGKLRRALLHVAARLHADVHHAGGAGSSTTDPIELIVQAGETLAKREMRDPSSAPLRRNIKRQKGRRREDAVVEIMTSGVEMFVTGSMPSPEALEYMADYLGVTKIAGAEVTREIVSTADPDAAQFVTHRHMQDALEAATLDDFIVTIQVI